MALKVYPNGITVAMNGNGKPPTAKRGDAQGWTKSAARRNTLFLMSIQIEQLTGAAFALTTTLAPDRIPGSREFHAMIVQMTKRLRRAGVIRWHWVIEFTRRGTPHVHWTLWVPEGTTDAQFGVLTVSAWLGICAAHGVRAGVQGQFYRPVTDAGWNQYVSKHGARGTKMYQRQMAAESLPDGWEKPGRMWGYGPRAQWPTPDDREPVQGDLTRPEFWRYRRLVRSWAIANARTVKNDSLRARYVRQARSLLSCADKRLSPVRPLTLWIPEDVSMRLLEIVISDR